MTPTFSSHCLTQHPCEEYFMTVPTSPHLNKLHIVYATDDAYLKARHGLCRECNSASRNP